MLPAKQIRGEWQAATKLPFTHHPLNGEIWSEAAVAARPAATSAIASLSPESGQADHGPIAAGLKCAP